MEIRDLRFFCMTAEIEHVTRAAEKLGVSQPFLTRVISNLEKEIGLSLFDNVGRKIRLNDNGETFFRHAKKVLADIEELNTEIGAMLNRHDKSISVLCNMSSFSPELIMAFRKKYPDYTISIEFATVKEIMEALAAGEADFAFCSPPLFDDPLKGLKTELLLCERCSILLPPGHPLIGLDKVTIDDIKNEQLITSSKGTGLRINIEQAFKKYDYRPQIVCESNDMNLIIRSVRDGMGYAIIPRWQLYSNPELKQYCVDVDIPETYAYIGVTYNTKPSAGVASTDFKNFVVQFLDEFKNRAYGNV